MTTRIWITRTEPAAARSARAWADTGFDPVVAPLLQVVPVTGHAAVPDDAELVFTSSHAVRHCGIEGDGRRVYAVGEATAKAARSRGFVNVVSGEGDWKVLSKRIENTSKPVLHISGSVVRGTLVETLLERGLKAERRIVYRSKPVADWPLDTRELDAVALYSPLASETLMALPERDLSGLTAYCLSANIAAPLHGIGVRIAEKPTEAALLACSRLLPD
ncbi:MAG: uroporphyrinogen-III synthase [Pseudomonadota bacterium]